MTIPASSTHPRPTSTSCDLEFQKTSNLIIDDEEWEEEETTTLFEFGKCLTVKDLEDAQYQCKLIGLESNTPFIQIGSSIFQGQLKNALGNDLIFSVTSDAAADDSSSRDSHTLDPSKYDHNHPSHYPQLRLEATINQRFCFQPVTLKPKKE